MNFIRSSRALVIIVERRHDIVHAWGHREGALRVASLRTGRLVAATHSSRQPASPVEDEVSARSPRSGVVPPALNRPMSLKSMPLCRTAKLFALAVRTPVADRVAAIAALLR
jgi:hypothetical protein